MAFTSHWPSPLAVWLSPLALWLGWLSPLAPWLDWLSPLAVCQSWSSAQLVAPRAQLLHLGLQASDRDIHARSLF